MIAALAEELSRHAAAADLVSTTDNTLTVVLDGSGDVAVEADDVAGLHVRVAAAGRVGWAGGSAASPAAVVEAALRSARTGEALELMFPAPSALPEVTTVQSAGYRLGTPEILAVARALRDRVARPGRRVEVWAQQSWGSVAVANTRGVAARYPRALWGVGAVVRTSDSPPDAPLRVEAIETAAVGLDAVAALAGSIDHWLGWPVVEPELSGPTRAWLMPGAVRTLLWPVLGRLTGEAWVGDARASFTLDPALSVVDDPLVPCRPGSRPICDDGVPTRPMVLVDAGQPRQGILDLMAACRSGLPATGHGVRRALGAPRAGFSNVRLLAGDASAEQLAAAVGDGLVVLELPWGPAPSRLSGVFRARAPWTFLLRGGEIVGRLPDAVVSGNAFDLLARVLAVGRDARWHGAWQLPSLVVEGLHLGRGS